MSELLTDEEAYAAYDAAAQYFFGMSGEEFGRRYDAGTLPENPAVIDVAILRPHEA